MKKCMPQIIDIQQEQKDSLLNQKEKKNNINRYEKSSSKILLEYFYLIYI